MSLFLSGISFVIIVLIVFYSTMEIIERIKNRNEKIRNEKEELIEKVNSLSIELNSIKRNKLQVCDCKSKQVILRFLDCVDNLNEIAEEIKKR